MDISKSSPAKRAAINTSLDDLVAYRANAGDETDRNIHMARFAQTGEVLDNAFANHVFSTMDKDTASRMTDATITANQAAIAQNVNSGQYKNIIQNMRNNAARKNLNDYMRSAAFAPGSNGANVQRIANTDPFLQNL